MLMLILLKLLQILASMVKNTLAANFSLLIAFPALVIPSLTGVSSELNPDENLSISAAQASWLGKIFENIIFFINR